MLAWRTAVLALAALVLLATSLAVRLFLVVLSTHNRPRPRATPDEASLAVFLGSGASLSPSSLHKEGTADAGTHSQAATRPR